MSQQPQTPQVDRDTARRMLKLKNAIGLVMLDEPYRAVQLSRIRYQLSEEVPNLDLDLEGGIARVNPAWLDRQKPDPLSKALLTGVAPEEEIVEEQEKPRMEDIEDDVARQVLENLRSSIEETGEPMIQPRKRRGGR